MTQVRLMLPERRMLDARQASDYLGLPLAVFKRECPVRAAQIGRHLRWDRKALDVWLDSLTKTEIEMTADDWLRAMDGTDAP